MSEAGSGNKRRLSPAASRTLSVSRRTSARPPYSVTCVMVEGGEADFHAGLSLFEKRPDKEWSLTDCLSFVVMKRRRLVDALTGDRHFTQAGFKALMR